MHTCKSKSEKGGQDLAPTSSRIQHKSYHHARQSAPFWHRAIGNSLTTRYLQAKLEVGPPGDRFEQEADRVAEHVINLPADHLSESNLLSPSDTSSILQRKCTSCEEEEESIQRKPLVISPLVQRDARTSGAISVPRNFRNGLNQLQGGGRPLNGSERSFYEPRFGRSFSEVRVHSGSQASSLASSINARAFTLGKDVVLGDGQYTARSKEGQRLMAHELTHVVQQSGAKDAIQRMRYATDKDTPAASFSANGFTLIPLTADEQQLVNPSIDLIRETVNNPDKFKDCHEHFESKCPSGGKGALKKNYDKAVIWKLTNSPGTYARGDLNGSHLGLTTNGLNQSQVGRARTIIHEMMHLCGVGGEDTHHLADDAEPLCIKRGPAGPFLNQLSFGVGPQLNNDTAVAMFAYRRLLTQWMDGHLNFTLGGNIDISGIGRFTADSEFSPQLPGEFGSLQFGLRVTSNPIFGQSEFFAWSGSVETGFGIGSFAMRSALPGEAPDNKVAGSYVFQVGSGPEFLLPLGEGVPLSFPVAWRMAQPLNGEAQRIHSLLFNIGIGF